MERKREEEENGGDGVNEDLSKELVEAAGRGETESERAPAHGGCGCALRGGEAFGACRCVRGRAFGDGLCDLGARRTDPGGVGECFHSSSKGRPARDCEDDDGEGRGSVYGRQRCRCQGCCKGALSCG